MKSICIAGILTLICTTHLRAASAVRTEPASRIDLTGIVAATGELQPIDVVEVGPQVAGTLVKFGPNSDYRSKVDAGAVLAQLDDSFLKIRVEQEEAHVRRLVAEATKTKSSKEDSEIAQAELAEAKAELKDAQLSLDAARITSPIKGTILDRRGEIGQAVAPNPNGPTMFSVWPDGEPMQLWAKVDEAHVAEISAGQLVQFGCVALPGKTFHGKVIQTRLDAARLHDTVQYTVEIEIDKANTSLLPYLTADVRIVTATHKNVLTVQNAALEWLPQSELLAAMRRQANPLAEPAPRSKSPRVWLLDGNSAKPVNVQIGASDGRSTEIIGGDLKEGDKVIVEGSLP
jgi:HlyD family secretion protein